VIRLVKEGQVQETVVAMPTTKRLDAEAITTTIVANLNDCGIDLQKMLYQCCMTVPPSCLERKVVSRKNIQGKLEKVISLVYWSKHQLHLVILHLVDENNDIKSFFGSCNKFRNLIRCPALQS